VVEDRYSSVFRLDHVRPGVVADGLAEAQVRFPNVPIVFCETRPLAQEWTYRFLGAALDELTTHPGAALLSEQLQPAGALSPPEPTTAEVRVWARAQGMTVSDRGRVRSEVWDAYRKEHPAD
jgi:hypothetical protein